MKLNSNQTTTRRLVACGLTGIGMLLASGCSTLPSSRTEPDHVFSTTTPQMLEREATPAPIPVHAHYPDENTTAAVGTSDTANYGPTIAGEFDGVVRVGGVVPQASEAGRLPKKASAITLASYEDPAANDEFLFASYSPVQDCPPGEIGGPRFVPGEPRLEYQPGDMPSNRMETIAASPLADLYPDEYVFDGGDRSAPASMHSADRSGLDSEDTVAAFRDHTGDARTTPSNRVAVYAPRFGSIRTVTGPQADTKVDRAAGAKDNMTVGNLKTGKAAQANIHDTVLYGLETRDRVDGMKAALPPSQSRRTDAAGQSRKVDEGHEGRSYASTNTFNRNQGFVLAQQMQNAGIWTRDQFPVITASTVNANEISAKFKVQQTIGVKDERETAGNVHIVKLADRDVAQSGDTITFTVRFENIGDFDVYEVRIVDNLTPRLEYVSGSASIDEDHPGEVSVEPNGEGSSILTFTLDQPLKGHESGTITFEAQVK